MNNAVDTISKSHEHFVKDFIKTYKENRVLWDQKHPKYKSKVDRETAFELLVSKSIEYLPDANMDFVKTKIDSIRGAFRREYKKVQESKDKAMTDEDIYVPALWYYNRLLFLVGEESKEELDVNIDSSKPTHLWSKHHTVILIDLLKKYPLLYSLDPPAHGTKSKRFKAYKAITTELSAETQRNFGVHEVKNKISTLKQQYRRESRERENKHMRRTAKLWCYDLLSFLKELSFPKKLEAKNEDEEMSDEETENLWINYEVDSDTDRKDEQMYQEENQDDIFDTIGKNVAIKLRDMNDDQRIYAEHLINEIMYHGLMENLNSDSRIIDV